MNNFFDDLSKAVNRVANNVSTEFSVAAQEQRLREAYQELGRLHYEAVQAGKTPDGDAFVAQMTRISTLLGDIQNKRRNQHVADV